MKTYVIASTEYSANMPDLFLMDESGKYYGVSQHSYAVWDNFPTDVNHWRNRDGSDADRYFNIDCVELADDLVKRFDELTAEYARLDREMPCFAETYPLPADFKTKKAYKQACDDYVERHRVWHKESNVSFYMRQKAEVWEERTKLFCTFSDKVYAAIRDNDNIR